MNFSLLANTKSCCMMSMFRKTLSFIICDSLQTGILCFSDDLQKLRLIKLYVSSQCPYKEDYVGV